MAVPTGFSVGVGTTTERRALQGGGVDILFFDTTAKQVWVWLHNAALATGGAEAGTGWVQLVVAGSWA